LQEWATYHDAEYCIAVMNGTSALELAMVGVGLEPGDEVGFESTKEP
jgi:dTDP-4-amino-4,6-dideoxygalactose transaminase